MTDDAITTEVATETAGAVTPESTPAAAESQSEATPTTTETAGAVTPESTPAAAESQVETTGQEGAEAPNGGKQSHQKSLDERVAELVGKERVKLEQELTEKLTQRFTQEKLDFIPDLDFAKVNAYIGEMNDAIEKARLDGDHLKAMDLQDQLAATRAEVKANEEKKAEYMRRQEVSQRETANAQAMDTAIAEAASLVAREFKIPEQVWKEAEDWFVAERAAKPLLNAQYRERVFLQGPIAGILFAKEYIEQNMGKKEEALIQQKETAKESLPAGKVSNELPVDANSAKLAELREKAQSGSPSDLAAYSEFKRSLQTTS